MVAPFTSTGGADTASTIPRRQLDALFNPTSVAFIGANDKSAFSAISFDVARRFGALDRTYLVNPNSVQVHHTPTYRHCVDVPGGVDCAYVMVPRERVPTAIEDAACAGARSAVVLTAGYTETGPDGARAQAELVGQCREAGITLLGPNILGYANVVAKTAVCALPGIPAQAGAVALVSQSGAGAGSLTRFVEHHGIRFSYAVTTGNEAMVCTEDVVSYLLDDEHTRAIAIFAETFRKPAAFLAAARKAATLNKALVVLKVGSSELSARTATAHTGALVGDDAVIDAVLRQEGVIRVEHMEDLLHCAHLAAGTGPWATAGVAVASLSGGACDVIADRAEQLGLALPELHSSTHNALSRTVSALGHIQNPLDVTGAGVTNPDLLADAAAALAADPSIGFVAVVGGRPTAAPMPALGAALHQADTPGAYVATVSSTLDEPTDAALQAANLLYIPSIRDAVTAMAKVSWWSQRLRQLRSHIATVGTSSSTQPADAGGEALSEVGVRDLLVAYGVPVVPAQCVSTAAQACAAATHAGGPVALKIVSADIAHKSDIGAVRLGVTGDKNVTAAFCDITSIAQAQRPRPHIEGVLVAPMRSEGTELIIGVTREPDWGMILAIGVGGIFVEVLAEAALLRLPAALEDIEEALRGLRGAALLGGVRGRPVTNLRSVATVIAAIADCAVALGDRLHTLEVNPLYARGEVIEALDGLVVWR